MHKRRLNSVEDHSLSLADCKVSSIYIFVCSCLSLGFYYFLSIMPPRRARSTSNSTSQDEAGLRMRILEREARRLSGEKAQVACFLLVVVAVRKLAVSLTAAKETALFMAPYV